MLVASIVVNKFPSPVEVGCAITPCDSRNAGKKETKFFAEASANASNFDVSLEIIMTRTSVFFEKRPTSDSGITA